MSASRVNRNFGGAPKIRMIVCIEKHTIEKLDQFVEAIRERRPGQGNRSEFVRQAIEEKMQRECA
ncbi:toxin-antitoxin system protein [Pseudomonas sp. YY-1]|uniref:toxin-antitoxin system protein n=1 Tax=Pseudomonas sp. YY-1 TaxID=2058659 RepID=UPI000CB9A1C8|nr:toxin-antitoxin system protein [Pseudomonas sp. YY-1]PKQ41119.1 toxin-antitoxin system protein [Pseudomonas sp. YY-1]